ncbi:MAG TPA: gamma-glutamyltransferase, partial [Candidatus Saccharimonadia bacterium]|nr:gamma-glutamyltransferase [Candidatus Saccharimonadia bacterium]
MTRMIRGALAPALLFACTLVFASPVETEALVPKAAEKPGAAAISSAHHLATDAGHEVLAMGGNAFDAAVAVSAALAVVEPSSSGIGGGAFWLLHRASDGRDVMIDARETAPAAIEAAMYLDDAGQLDRDKSVNGALAAGIPGQPAGLVHLAKRYGRLPLSKSLAPAIRLAKQGFPFGPRLKQLIGNRVEVLKRWPASARIFLADGKIPANDALIRQPDLARTLEAIAKRGHDGFYRGEVARKLVDGVVRAGGVWSLEDLASYKVVEREPLRTSYRGHHVVTAPPPSGGGIGMITMLNVLEGYDLAAADGTQRVHLVVEAMRRAFRDRSFILGDPDFVKMPIALLADKAYAAG